MTVQPIFIGIDGGGTKTTVRVEDRAGHFLSQAEGGPANIRFSVEGAWQSIHMAIEQALKPLNLSLSDSGCSFHTAVGIAGSEIKTAWEQFSSRPHRFKTLKLTSDVHIACLGAHQGDDGAIIIAGTGIIGYQIIAGQSSRAGGWGFPHDDQGSGAWLGLEAVRLTLQWLDQRVERTRLAEEVFAYFKHDEEQLVGWAHEARASEFARLAPVVVSLSQQGDPPAVHLMKQAAQAAREIYYGLIKKRNGIHERLPCCLMGGMAPFILPWLDKDLSSSFVTPQNDAMAGALWLIRQEVTG
jgi:glucosamine kinase